MSDMYYPMTIAGLERRLPLCPIGDDLMIGAFVIFGDPELTTACAKALLERCPEHDVMITAESKGIPLICEMARMSGNERYVLEFTRSAKNPEGTYDLTFRRGGKCKVRLDRIKVERLGA